MTIKDVLKNKKISMYRLAKQSDVPYTTINDLCSGKTSPEKCSAETIYKIARALEIPMEDLLAPYMVKRSSFGNFRSAVCHQLKTAGDIPFILDTLEKDDIRRYFERGWYPECLYLLAMIDYLSRINQIPLCRDYDHLRSLKLQEPLYPLSIRAFAEAAHSDEILKMSVRTAIPEFIRFNIVENEVRDVC